MSKRMTKRTRSLLYAVIALAAVAVLLVGLLLLLPEPNEDPNEGNTPVDESVVLFDKSGDNKTTLSTAVISVAGTSYTISFTKDELYTVNGYEDLPLDQLLLAKTAGSLLTVKATRLVLEAPETPADFGFEKADGGITVSATYSDNSTFSFEIGDLAPSEDGYYLRESGKTAVYLMDTTFCETMGYAPDRYINRSPITAPLAVESTDAAVVRDVTLTGTVRPQDIFFQVAPQPKDDEETMVVSGYAIQRPHFHGVDSNSPLITLTTFTSTTASGVAKLRPTGADLAAYGLSKPYSACTVNLSLQRTTEKTDADGKPQTEISYHGTFTYTVKLGKTDKDSNYYGVVYAENELIPVVYLFPSETVSAWVEAQYEDIADDMLYFQYITNLTSLSINSTTFALEHFPKEEDNDKTLVVKAGGNTYSTPDFRTLYSTLLTLYRVSGTDEKPTGTPILKLQFTPMKQYGNAVRIEIYEYTAGYCIAVHNSGEKHLINAKDVQAFQAKYQKFLAGESISE